MFIIDSKKIYETEHEMIREIYSDGGGYDAIYDQVRGIIRYIDLLLSKGEES